MKYCYQLHFHIGCVPHFYTPSISRQFNDADLPLEIIDIVCIHFGLLNYEISHKTRKREIVDARHIAMYLISVYRPKMYLNPIGEFFKRDHATVIFSKHKCEDLIGSNKEFKNNVIELTAKIDSYIQRTTVQ